MHTKESIIELLKTNDKAVCRALIVLRNRQTADEQNSMATKHTNGVGFNSMHAYIGTGMADQYEKRGFLTPKQIQYWRHIDGRGVMRIGQYWKQLLDEANKKAVEQEYRKQRQGT